MLLKTRVVGDTQIQILAHQPIRLEGDRLLLANCLGIELCAGAHDVGEGLVQGAGFIRINQVRSEIGYTVRAVILCATTSNTVSSQIANLVPITNRNVAAIPEGVDVLIGVMGTTTIARTGDRLGQQQPNPRYAG